MQGILSVRQLTDRLKQVVEGTFPYVWVQGEVSNLTRPASGHVYFSLKDSDAVLSCVWFRGRQKLREAVDPLTGEVFEDGPRPSLATTLRNGQTITCAGQLTVYAPRGGYQLMVDLAQDTGEGLLYQALEQLKQRLLAEGLFDPVRKRPLPPHSARVAVITSPTGAAIQDFVRIAEHRGTGAQLRIYPTLVQGDEAPAQLVQAIAQANADIWTPAGDRAEVLVIIRGGGSLQDLWAFNDERVARAVADSALPVLTGIGHEIDTSVADMAADVRAATPSHAAQLLWPEREWYAQRVDDLEQHLLKAFDRRLHREDVRLKSLEQGLDWLSPLRHLARMGERTDELATRLHRAMYGPTDQSGLMGRHTTALTLLDARLQQAGRHLTERPSHRLHPLILQLQAAGSAGLDRAERQLERLEAQLTRCNPLEPLERGYALVRLSDGRVVRGVGDVQPGDATEVLVRDGSLKATITSVHSHDAPDSA